LSETLDDTTKRIKASIEERRRDHKEFCKGLSLQIKDLLQLRFDIEVPGEFKIRVYGVDCSTKIRMQADSKRCLVLVSFVGIFDKKHDLVSLMMAHMKRVKELHRSLGISCPMIVPNFFEDSLWLELEVSGLFIGEALSDEVCRAIIEQTQTLLPERKQ
jgi:hypothetical protein